MPDDRKPKKTRRRALRATNRAMRLAKMRGVKITMTLEQAYLLKCAAWDGPEAEGLEQHTLDDILNRIESEVNVALNPSGGAS